MTLQIARRAERPVGKSVLNLLVAMLLLTAAYSHARAEPTNATEPTRAMIGMTKDRIKTCMGPPHSVSGSGGEFWTYRSANRAKSAGSCEATLIFRDNTLGQVTFRGDTGSVVTKNGVCGFLVKNCIK